MAEIEFDDVVKRYPDGFEAVKHMNLQIRDGELMILVGPSGCGKSTALRMIAGLEDISEGDLKIGGEVVNDLAPKDRDIAMVFQNYALYPHMTVRENMGFALKLRKAPEDDIKRRVDEAPRVLELEQHLGPKPRPPPGGGPAGSSPSSPSSASRRTSPAASASASRWAARSCASRRRSSWTSRCRTSTRSCASRCGRSSRACSSAWRRRPSTSPTTRPRP